MWECKEWWNIQLTLIYFTLIYFLKVGARVSLKVATKGCLRGQKTLEN